MKSIRRLLLVGLVVCCSVKADILRLRDGRMFTGSFLGASRSEIWFQRDAPGQVIGTGAYPIEQVESLTFGPVMRQSSLGAANGCLAELVASTVASRRSGPAPCSSRSKHSNRFAESLP